jgi:hypothetical protein
MRTALRRTMASNRTDFALPLFICPLNTKSRTPLKTKSYEGYFCQMNALAYEKFCGKVVYMLFSL